MYLDVYLSHKVSNGYVQYFMVSVSALIKRAPNQHAFDRAKFTDISLKGTLSEFTLKTTRTKLCKATETSTRIPCVNSFHVLSA